MDFEDAARYSVGTPSTISMLASPCTRSAFAGESSVSMVNATT